MQTMNKNNWAPGMIGELKMSSKIILIFSLWMWRKDRTEAAYLQENSSNPESLVEIVFELFFLIKVIEIIIFFVVVEIKDGVI